MKALYFLILTALAVTQNALVSIWGINKHYEKKVQIRSFFRSVFSCNQAQYGEMLRISPYSVRMRENTDHVKLRIWTHFTQCELVW